MAATFAAESRSPQWTRLLAAMVTVLLLVRRASGDLAMSGEPDVVRGLCVPGSWLLPRLGRIR
jgi:hypothetical protein